MSKTCLLITERFEPTADVILAELRRRDIPVLRWNLDQYPVDAVLTYRVSNDLSSGEISNDGRRLDIADIGSIWCRGFRPSGFPEGLGEEELKFLREEAQRTLDALLTIADVKWVNHPQNYTRASAKPAQLRVARQVGLEIPHTLFTNDPDEVRRFMARSEGATVYKAHSQSLNLEPGAALYTGVLTKERMEELDSVRVSPGIFQGYVEKAYEVRATVVGPRIFAARINSQTNDETKIDWRRRPYDIEDRSIELPSEIQEKIHKLMHTFGLSYGALDFIVTPEGQYVFLEVNPAGQYLWVEAQTKMPITAALADLLSESGSN